MQARMSKRMERLGPSPVREILAAAAGRSIISLAGGLPDESSFPQKLVLPVGWEQYGITEGDLTTRQAVALHLRSRGLNCSAEQILLTHGSQQGLDLVAKLLVDEGTKVGCRAPTYVSALQVFRLFGADLRGGRFHAEQANELTTWLETERPDLFYAIPNGDNPTGSNWSEELRIQFAAKADELGMCVVEDDPYGELWFDFPPGRPLCARLEKAPWIFLGSFSKSFLPGLRLGFMACSPEFRTPLERLKQAADLHSNRLSQALVLADLTDPQRRERMDALRESYRQKRDGFAIHLKRNFPKARWELPPSGLFFWAELAPGKDLRPFSNLAMEAGVAFLPGEHCYPQNPDLGWARLNFSHAAPEMAEEGLRRLAKVLSE